ncbi:MAG TPA: hypothetical protein VF816_09230 [Rhodocyclaceae bacterium]
MEAAAPPRKALAGTAWRAIAASRAASILLLASFFWMVAAAACAGFLGKWGLRDDAPRFTIERMLDGTAYRPFVYRQLVPLIANAADRALPAPVKRSIADHLSPEPTFTRTIGLFTPGLRFRYVVVCYLSFAALFGSLFVLRLIALDTGATPLAALLAPVSLVLALPYLQTRGGYFYDCAELFFLSLAFLLALRGKALWLIALVVPAALNKESFFFFLPALYPLLRTRLPRGRAAAATAAGLLVAGAVALWLEHAFAASPGGAIELHLLDNLPTLATPHAYRETELTYGIIGPSGLSFAALAIASIVATRGAAACPPAVRHHLSVAAAINLPLLLALGVVGELRDLSLLFVGFMVLLATSLGTPDRKGSSS